MTNAEKFARTFGLFPKPTGEPIVLDKIWLEGEYFEPTFGKNIIGVEDIGKYIQHVSYEPEQMGYEK